FVLILDGFDEMKFAMAPNDFAFFSAEIRKAAKANSHLLILGRPDVLETEDDAARLLSSKIRSYSQIVPADESPDFDNVRLAFLSKDEYLFLIRNFLQTTLDAKDAARIPGILEQVEKLDLTDILHRPVQAKMLAEIVKDKNTNLTS